MISVAIENKESWFFFSSSFVNVALAYHTRYMGVQMDLVANLLRS
jgi:hypothetical protein